MERHIKFSDLQDAVTHEYEKYKALEVKGDVDPRLSGVDADKFGVVVTLADGRTFAVGDVDTPAPLGRLASVAAFTVLRQQKLNNPDKKHSQHYSLKEREGEKPHHLPVSVNGVRLVSKLQPQGDADGKWDVLMDTTINMMGAAPELNDALYQSMMKTNEAAGVVNAMAQTEWYLYDDAALSVETYTKLTAMQASARQLAQMGATISADGKNPTSGRYAFDGAIAPKIVAFMAVKGPHHLSKPWLIKSGLPARDSFGGTMMGVLPGIMAIAAYSPLVDANGVSVKAYKVMHHVMKRLGISAFDSATTVID